MTSMSKKKKNPKLETQTDIPNLFHNKSVQRKPNNFYKNPEFLQETLQAQFPQKSRYLTRNITNLIPAKTHLQNPP